MKLMSEEQIPTLISRGDAARDLSDWTVAEEAYGSVVELDPSLSGIWVQLGHALKENGKIEEATNAYRQALALVPEDDDAYLQLGHVLKLAGDEVGAVLAYRKSLQLNATSEPAISELKSLNFPLLEPRGGEISAGELAWIRSLISRADAARDGRDWTAAEAAYGAVVELDPGLGGIWVQFGHSLKENGRLDKAVEAYCRAIALTPGDDDAHLQLGHVLKLAGDQAGALLAYRKSLNLNPASAPALAELEALNISNPSVQKIEFEDRDEQLGRLISCGDSARDRRDWLVAEEAYRAVVELNPALGGMWVQLGHALKESGNLEDAAEAYRQAIAVNPEDDDAHLQLGHLLKLAGDTGGALLAYRNSLKINPTSPAAIAELRALDISSPPKPIAEETSGLDSAVRERLDRLISQGDAARDRRDWAAAEEAYGNVVEADSKLGGIWVQFGHALKETGKLNQAANAYRQAIALDPEDDDAHLQLGHALKLAGDESGALLSYRRSLEINPTSEQAIAELRSFNSQNIKVPPDETIQGSQRAQLQDPALIAQLVNELQSENELLSQQLQKELQKNLQLTRLGSGAGPRPDKYWKKYHSSLIIMDFRDEVEGDNWYPAVSGGRWAGPGERSSVRFPALRDGEYEMRLYIVDSADAELLEKLRISINGIPISPERMAAGSAGIVSARFSTKSLPDAPVWEFEFAFPSLGELRGEGGQDPRKQTILMKSLTLKCTSEA